jgi:hypothetical protein
MPVSFRLKKNEQDCLKKLCIQLNRHLLERDTPAIKESDLIHEILDFALPRIVVTKSGQLKIHDIDPDSSS